MALSNSLYTGVSGLRNHQSMLDVIGNNVANVNTIGYKGSRITFSDTFNQFVEAGTNPTDTSGGTNTFQIGLGMKTASIDRNWSQGTFESTSNTTDLALQGDGLFVLSSNGERYYTRAGSFNVDANGQLVSSSNGAIVQGKVANSDGDVPPGNNLEDIVIDTDLKLPAVATTLIKWGGNLQSDSDLTRSESVVQRGNINSSEDGPFTTQATVYNDAGDEYTVSTTYTRTADHTYDMSWSVTDSEAAEVGTGSISGLVFDDADGDESYELSEASTALFDGVNNNMTITDENLNFDITATALTDNASTSTLSLSADGNRDPNVISGSVTVYDSLGTSHEVTLTFTKVAVNTWSWTASVPGTSTDNGLEATSSGKIEFNSDGTLDSSMITPNDPQLTFTPSGGANPEVIDLNFGSAFEGVTQTSSSSVISSLSQDGSASASLSDINIDQYGNVVGVFSNGNSKTLAQVMVATFSNYNGLISAGDNMYSAYANSGDPKIVALGEESGTTVQSSALEQSNVDLSEEFTKMIISQRGYQANARVITTADSLLQEITNLIG